MKRQITGKEDVLKEYIYDFSGYTDKELIKKLNNATEEEIEKDPLSFYALFEVARDRGLFPKKQENK